MVSQGGGSGGERSYVVGKSGSHCKSHFTHRTWEVKSLIQCVYPVLLWEAAAGSSGYTCPSLGVLPCVWTTDTGEMREAENSANTIAREAFTEKVLWVQFRQASNHWLQGFLRLPLLAEDLLAAGGHWKKESVLTCSDQRQFGEEVASFAYTSRSQTNIKGS